MAGAFVQSWSNTGTSSVTVTLSGTTSNNLLIAALAVRADATAINTPSGWTLMNSETSGDADGAVFYRISDGTETSVVFTWTGGNAGCASVCEYSGLSTSSPLEDTDENITYITTQQTALSPINCGTATPISSNGMAFAVYMGPDERQCSDTELSIDNSYVEDDYVSATGANPVVQISSKTYTSTASQSPNYSSSRNAAWNGYTTIAVFKEPATGGATPKGPLGHPLHGPFGGPV